MHDTAWVGGTVPMCGTWGMCSGFTGYTQF